MFTEPIKALINLNFYKEVAKKSIWRALLYSVYLFAVYMLVISIATSFVFKPKIHNFINKHADSIPHITYDNGILNVNDNETLAIVISQKNDVRIEKDWENMTLAHNEGFILANTSRTEPVSLNEMKQNNIAAYLTKDTFYIIKNYNSMQASPIPKVNLNVEITPEILHTNIISITKGIISFMVTIIGLFTILKMMFFTISIFLLGLTINSFRKAFVTPGEMFKWSIYLVTPILLIGLVSTLLSFKIPFAFAIYLIIAGFYLDRILKKEDKESEDYVIKD